MPFNDDNIFLLNIIQITQNICHNVWIHTISQTLCVLHTSYITSHIHNISAHTYIMYAYIIYITHI